MEQPTRPDESRSPLGTLALLALTFALGYALGSRSGRDSGEWQDVPSEPTEITIDGDEDGAEE
ncbi:MULTISPECIES: hypothetical protein [Halorussus]|uniref:hypothetical protein n=1 Tax=Halorussus TaxID=1070314 RepID=UPI000E218044|nr:MULTISPECIES: hypothetical protein [Halorussus]NHN61198.1 hypothetical protein [Halorussus sp. JP-T4]